MLAHPTGRAEKLFYIEKGPLDYQEVTDIPEEYLQLILPYAGIYFEKDAECDIISQHIELEPFSLWVQEVYAHKDLVLCPYTPHHIWALHFMYEASLQVELYEDRSFTLVERECNLFNLESDLHKVPMTAGQKLLSCHINITPKEFVALAVKYPKLRPLATKQSNGISGPLNQHPYHINPVCSYLLQRMLTCRHVNIPAHHFLYRCCLDLFLNFAQQDQQLPMLLNNILHTDELNQVFRYIVDTPQLKLTIPDLAHMFNLTTAGLRDGFIKHFSMPVNQFIRMIKMMMVFELLTEKDISLRDITAAAGYSNWQSLNRAFKTYYGCELDELRRAM